jgi:hypothetical protein
MGDLRVFVQRAQLIVQNESQNELVRSIYPEQGFS